jgi:hypothetical protein
VEAPSAVAFKQFAFSSPRTHQLMMEDSQWEIIVSLRIQTKQNLPQQIIEKVPQH